MPAVASNAALFAFCVVTSTAGLLMLTGSLSRIRAAGGPTLSLTMDGIFLVMGFGLCLVSFLVWIRIFSRLPLSSAYPIAIGLTLAFSTSGAFLLLGERLAVPKIAGILLIFLGCITLTVERFRP